MKSIDRLVCWLDCLAQVFVTDLGKEYGGWPLNDMERSYKFMLRHVRLWKVAFHGTSPRSGLTQPCMSYPTISL